MSNLAIALIFLAFCLGIGIGIREGRRQMFETLKGKLR